MVNNGLLHVCVCIQDESKGDDADNIDALINGACGYGRYVVGAT